MTKTINPFNSKDPRWKNFGLGVLAAQGRISRSDVDRFMPGSPSYKAFHEGFNRECELSNPDHFNPEDFDLKDEEITSQPTGDMVERIRRALAARRDSMEIIISDSRDAREEATLRIAEETAILSSACAEHEKLDELLCRLPECASRDEEN